MGTFAAMRFFDGLPRWCDLCVARAQLDYSRKSAEKIVELECKVASLEVLYNVVKE